MKKTWMILFASAALGGCNFAESASDSAPVDTRTAATPAPVASAAKPSANVLTPEGWGPLRIGMTRAEIDAALGPDANPESVGGPEPEVCDIYRPSRAPESMRVMVESGKLSRIELVEASNIKTPQGFSVGDSADSIKQALGDALIIEPHKYADAPSEYLTIWNGGPATGPGGYVEDVQARGIRYDIGDDGNVSLIFAGGPAIQYVEGCL